ncbi:MAG: YfbU family protein [Pseudomonadota bacterium]
MQTKTERFEMRLDQAMVDRLDAWRSQRDDVPSRAEAARRLIEIGLQQYAAKGVRISDGEKLILSMLRDLYRHLEVKGGEIDPDFVLSALVGGHYWGLAWEHGGLFHGHEDREQAVSEVVNILDMWSFLESGYARLTDDDKARIASELESLGKDVRFPGFDGNNESEHYSISRFLIDDMDRFSSFKGRDLNSHHPVLDGYRRMLLVFEPKRRTLTGGELDVSQIIAVLHARMRG